MDMPVTIDLTGIEASICSNWRPSAFWCTRACAWSAVELPLTLMAGTLVETTKEAAPDAIAEANRYTNSTKCLVMIFPAKRLVFEQNGDEAGASDRCRIYA